MAAVTIVFLAACAGGGARPAGGGAEPVVVAAVYPLAFAAERVGAGGARVQELTPAGAEPHDVELTPSQVAALAEADLVVYVGAGFQPAVEDALAGLEAARLDVLEVVEPLAAGEHAEDEQAEDGHAHGSVDPHVWLDPLRLAEIGAAIAAELGDINPAGRDTYLSHAGELRAELARLDDAFERGLDRCARRAMVVSHEAFGYLAARYDLEQIGISGIDPEAEPSPARLAEVAGLAREHGATTIFFERLVSPRAAQAIAAEIGVDTAVLDPLESAPEQGDYLSAMRANLDNLRAALGCP